MDIDYFSQYFGVGNGNTYVCRDFWIRKVRILEDEKSSFIRSGSIIGMFHY